VELLGGGVMITVLCLMGLLGLGGLVGLGLILLKLGVIGSYWLKGEEPGDEIGDYQLDQSREAIGDGKTGFSRNDASTK
jgi:hypothetical protein